MSESRAGRVAVIGDVGGHRTELERELRRLGADSDTGRLPADLTIVQVGDLIHRGPDSEGVVALVDRYLTEQPAQWRQLVGNHEAQYVVEPVFEWPERIGDDAIDTLRAWWRGRQLRAAVALDTAEGPILVTHAGLTAGFWRAALDAPQSPADAARALNSFAGTHDDVLFRSGEMLGSGGRDTGPDYSAGPVWAAAATELVPSWLAEASPAPFGQVHGHSMVADWHRRALRGGPDVAALTVVDEPAAHEVITLPNSGARIIGVDPGHGAKPRRRWQAYVFDGARVLD